MIPRKFLQTELASLLAPPRCSDARMRAAVERYDGQKPMAGMLLGPTGVGKSSVAAWLARRWLGVHKFELEAIREAQAAYSPGGGHYTKDAQLPVHFAWVDSVELSLAERRHKLGEGEPLLLACASTVRWLVLDDLGFEKDTTAITLVLQRRYVNDLPTLLTSGLRKEEITAHYGAWAVRRMAEHKGQGNLVVDLHV